MRYAGAIALVAVALTIAGCTRPSDATPSATASPLASPTASPPATASATPAVVTPATLPDGAAVFTRHVFGPGNALDAAQGAAVVDAATGHGELWRLDDSLLPQTATVAYAWSPNGGALVAQAFGAERAYAVVLVRGPGAAVEWNMLDWQLAAGPSDAGLILLAANRACRYLLVDIAATPPRASEVRPFGDCIDRSTTGGVFSTTGSSLLVVNGGDVAVVDTSTGAAHEVDHAPVVLTPYALPDGGFLAVRATGAHDAQPVRVFVRRYDASGRPAGATEIPASQPDVEVEHIVPSPDGHAIAWQQSLLPAPLGSGGHELWPAVYVADVATGAARFRAVRASLTNGTLEMRWLADSSAVVVDTEDRFAALGVDGRLSSLPFPPADHFAPVPLPSPVDTSRFLYDGRVVAADGRPAGTASPRPRGDPRRTASRPPAGAPTARICCFAAARRPARTTAPAGWRRSDCPRASTCRRTRPPSRCGSPLRRRSAPRPPPTVRSSDRWAPAAS